MQQTEKEYDVPGRLSMEQERHRKPEPNQNPTSSTLASKHLGTRTISEKWKMCLCYLPSAASWDALRNSS